MVLIVNFQLFYNFCSYFNSDILTQGTFRYQNILSEILTIQCYQRINQMESQISLQLLDSDSTPKKSQNCSQNYLKVEIYILSFLAYTSVHALKTSYSFSKSQLPDQIGIDSKYIGLVDSAMLFFLGIGNTIIALNHFKHPIRMLWVAMVLCALQYLLMPISMTYLSSTIAFVVLTILMSLNGFLQAFTWPNLLTLVHRVVTPQKNGALLGFWSTNGNFGNILGFIISQYFVLGLDLRWQTSPIIVSSYMLILGFLIALRIQQEDEKPESSDTQTNLSVTPRQYPSLKDLCSSKKKILIAISFSLVKSVMIGILLWLPVYFHEIGLIDYQLYIPMAFDVSSVIGSVFLGAIFKRLSNKNKNALIIPFLILLIVFFTLLKSVQLSVVGYFCIIGCVGFCLGGTYNTMASLVTMQLVVEIPKELQDKYLRFYSAILMAVAYFTASITQIVIGLTVVQDQDSLFQIFLIYTIFNLISMIGLVILEHSTFFMNSAVSLSNQQNSMNISTSSHQKNKPVTIEMCNQQQQTLQAQI